MRLIRRSERWNKLDQHGGLKIGVMLVEEAAECLERGCVGDRLVSQSSQSCKR